MQKRNVIWTLHKFLVYSMWQLLNGKYTRESREAACGIFLSACTAYEIPKVLQAVTVSHHLVLMFICDARSRMWFTSKVVCEPLGGIIMLLHFAMLMFV